MKRGSIAITTAACVALIVSPVAEADRVEPPPIYGYYSAFIAARFGSALPTGSA